MTRASLYLYNTTEDVDALVRVLAAIGAGALVRWIRARDRRRLARAAFAFAITVSRTLQAEVQSLLVAARAIGRGVTGPPRSGFAPLAGSRIVAPWHDGRPRPRPTARGRRRPPSCSSAALMCAAWRC